ncbi:fatty acid desaturase [Rhodospirillaceae bacterium SYSU D60014]|uniref:fatty acid desaturase n=1 Tax=Virgifigura deserti TaxID=2268457 RepID=UPI000E6729A8
MTDRVSEPLGAPAISRKSATFYAVDWPTIAVTVVVYAGFLLVTWFYDALPWWAVGVFGGAIVCLHGSLQHEAVHAQPTRTAWLNALLVFPSLWLWLPFSLYRESHLAHHRDERLTDPLEDPESNYLRPADWQAMGPLHRLIRRALATLLGRLLLGPPYVALRVLATLARRLGQGDRHYLRHWLLHVPAVTLVLLWVIGICGIPFGEYLLLFVYPGMALTLLRSFAEHRAAAEVAHRTALVEAGPLMSLLYLNNNLHLVHHNEPGLPWHQRPARYRAYRAALLEANGGNWYGGYGELLARYLLRAREPVVHPLIES